MRCHIRKTASHKGTSLSSSPSIYPSKPHTWPARSTSKGLGKIPAERHYSPTGAAGFHFVCLSQRIRGSSTVPTLLIQRTAGCNAPWGLLGTCNPIIHLPLQTWFFTCPSVGSQPRAWSNLLSICPPVLGRFPRSPFPSRQETRKLPNSSANSSTLASCWHLSLSLSLGIVSHSKKSLCLNLHLLESKWGILYFH